MVQKGWLAKLTAIDEISKIVHDDETTKVLSVEDPQLVFYLRNLLVDRLRTAHWFHAD